MAPTLSEDEVKVICQEYLEGKSCSELGNKYHRSSTGMMKVLRRAGITLRKRGNSYKELPDNTIATIVEMWNNGESQYKIGQATHLHQTIIGRILSGLGYKSERRVARKESHGFWKGGRVKANEEGYVLVRMETNHPFAREMRRIHGYCLEHRLVMAEAIGRPLLDTETVHHINGDVTDNRIENLQLRQGKHGKGTRHHCLSCGSFDIESIDL